MNVALRAGDVVIVPGSTDSEGWDDGALGFDGRRLVSESLDTGVRAEAGVAEDREASTGVESKASKASLVEADDSVFTVPVGYAADLSGGWKGSALSGAGYFGIRAVAERGDGASGGVVFWD